MPIVESWPWKAKIAKYADVLESLRDAPGDWEQEEGDQDPVVQWWADFEEAIMAGAFAIRKLIESEKLSYEAQSIVIACKNSPKVKAPTLKSGAALSPSYMDRDKLDRYFDVEKKTAVSIKLKDFLNQVIHSMFFDVEWEADSHELVLTLCSDHRFSKGPKSSGLLWITLSRIIDVFREIAEDDIVLALSPLNQETGVRETIGFRELRTAVELGIASESGVEPPPPPGAPPGRWIRLGPPIDLSALVD